MMQIKRRLCFYISALFPRLAYVLVLALISLFLVFIVFELAQLASEYAISLSVLQVDIWEEVVEALLAWLGTWFMHITPGVVRHRANMSPAAALHRVLLTSIVNLLVLYVVPRLVVVCRRLRLIYTVLPDHRASKNRDCHVQLRPLRFSLRP